MSMLFKAAWGAARRASVCGAGLALLAVPTAHAFAAASAMPPRAVAGAGLYTQHCGACHGPDRLGGNAPALLPGNLQRLSPQAAFSVISEGRRASRMPAFAALLSPSAIDSLVDYIYTEPAETPRWEAREIAASHRVLPAFARAMKIDRPLHHADPLNLFTIVEAGSHHVTVLDGDTFEPVSRFKSRHALHGGLKYSSDGRYVFLASRDGWIAKYDLYSLDTVAETRAGINTRNLAVSADDRYVMVGNYLPHSLVLLDAEDLSLMRIWSVKDRQGVSSRVSAVYTAAPRTSFIVALKDVRELWEISYSDTPEPVFNGLVHDYRLGEGLAETGRFPIRRIALEDYLDDFFFDPTYTHIVATSRQATRGQVINMIVGRRIASVDLPGMPHLGSGITWPYRNTTVLATPDLATGAVSIIDTDSWQTLKKIPTLGPGFFMRSHEASRYAWVDVFSGPHRDVMHVIDKSTLEVVRSLRPSPGQTSAHVEFTRDGRYALVSVWEHDGEVVVYDADTLEVVKRVPAVKPVGKYNVYNKIARSAGTSH